MSEENTLSVTIKEEQRRRADNQIWNVADDYDFNPEFRAYDDSGNAELYQNGIIGAYYKYYAADLVPLWEKIHGAIAEDVCEQLVWIGIENACFERESELRPAFPFLRRAYARRVLNDFHVDLPYPYNEVYKLSLIRALTPSENVTGTISYNDDKIPSPESGELLSRLLFTGDMSGEEINRAALKFLDERILLLPKETQPEDSGKRFRLPFRRKAAKNDTLPGVRKCGAVIMEHGDPSPEQFVSTGKHYIFDMTAGQSDAAIHKYIHDIFGRPIFPEETTARIERLLCCGEHENCHLYYAEGDGYLADDLQGYAGIMRRNAVAQMGRNREFYRENMAVTRTSINRLTEKWQNAILTYRQDECLKSDFGHIVSNRIWRLERLDDQNIFERTIPADDSDIYVDILIDGSFSQEERQMKVALQAYIIAEALTRCRINVRVCSFSSVSGYTCITRFRDYGDNKLNDRIFNFTTCGGNRDGLGLRMMGHLFENDNIEAGKRILIVLSDTRPNDSINIITNGHAQMYKEEAAVENTAKEVRALKNRGISVICVYTGTDRDLPAAHKIYNRDFVRIRRLEDFAQAVGGLFLTSLT